jgi:predicted CXXCH cytochrome family protein
MKKISLIFAAIIMVTFTASSAFAAPGDGVVGSLHDLGSLIPDGQVCVACHAPHNGQNADVEGLLWNHATSSATYQMYASTGLTNFIDNTINTEPSGVSKLCLSCHDGTVAYDAYGGNAGANTMTGANLIGTDLTNDHPISVVYDNTIDEGLNPTTFPIGGQSIAQVLDAGEVQCSSCHDVHNEEATDAKLLRASLTDSAICTACHTK